MVEVVVETPMVLASPLVLDFKAIEMTDDQFVQFCADNDDLRIELTAKRELIVMPPTNLETGSENLSLSAQLYNWTRQDGSGIGFDSSSMFTLPNGAVRSLDASWMLRERWVALPLEERRRFSHIVPDFVAELRSPSDRLSYVQLKMEEYMENGARLGWLIDPFQRRVYVHRPGQPVEVLENPARVSGEDVLPGFELNPQEIWEPL